MRPSSDGDLTILATSCHPHRAGLVGPPPMGSPPRLPAPFGPARNGQIVFSTPDGDIAAVDPVTGTVDVADRGPEQDSRRGSRPMGRQFAFDRRSRRSQAAYSLRMRTEPACVSSSAQHRRSMVRVVADAAIGSSCAARPAMQGVASVMDVASGSPPRSSWRWRSTSRYGGRISEQFVITMQSETGGAVSRVLYTVDSDGTGLRQIATVTGLL